MIHSLILSDRRNNQYKTLGILIFIIYPILSFPFILKGILKRERWAYLLGAILMGYIGMLYPPAGDMYRYAEDFNLYKELDWEYFWGRKINCVMRCSRLNSSVGDRPAPRGGTTRPDERKVTTI